MAGLTLQSGANPRNL